MQRMLWAMTIAVGSAGGLACDRPSPSQQPDPAGAGAAAPATNPSGSSASQGGPATQAAAIEPATQPTASSLTIRGAMVPFPPAVLRLVDEDGRIVALVFSDDPKSAMDDEYDGNSYYLQIPLDIDDPAALHGAAWTFKATTSEPEDSPYGIFLEGRRWQLHPDDVRVEFEGAPDAPLITVWVGGTFLAVDTTGATPSQRVPVAGKLTAVVQQKKRG